MEEAVVRAEAVTRTYGDGAGVAALREVWLRVARGEFLAVRGPSGAGKTTLLNVIGTLDRPTAGRVVVDGVDVGRLSGDALADFRRGRIGFVFQLFHLVPTLTAVENVMLPLLPYRRRLPFELADRARELLARVGMGGRFDHLPGELSGGEQQRVAIARALVNRPTLVLADEPTGNLDGRSAGDVVGLLRELNAESGITVVLATHDQAVAGWAGRVVQLRDGRVAEAG